MCYVFVYSDIQIMLNWSAHTVSGHSVDIMNVGYGHFSSQTTILFSKIETLQIFIIVKIAYIYD